MSLEWLPRDDEIKNHALFGTEHWLAANMTGEALLGFTAFNSRKMTGIDNIDFIQYRQLMAAGAMMDDELFAAVPPKPKEG